jgi:hypothetical protein
MLAAWGSVTTAEVTAAKVSTNQAGTDEVGNANVLDDLSVPENMWVVEIDGLNVGVNYWLILTWEDAGGSHTTPIGSFQCK